MAQYVALTTHGSGWFVALIGEAGESRDAVEARALAAICGPADGTPLDIYQDTERKNLLVVSKTQAQRRFPQAWFNATDPETLFSQWVSSGRQ